MDMFCSHRYLFIIIFPLLFSCSMLGSVFIDKSECFVEDGFLVIGFNIANKSQKEHYLVDVGVISVEHLGNGIFMHIGRIKKYKNIKYFEFASPKNILIPLGGIYHTAKINIKDYEITPDQLENIYFSIIVSDMDMYESNEVIHQDKYFEIIKNNSVILQSVCSDR